MSDKASASVEETGVQPALNMTRQIQQTIAAEVSTAIAPLQAENAELRDKLNSQLWTVVDDSSAWTLAEALEMHRRKAELVLELQAELEQAKERINELWNHAQEQSDQLDLNIDEFLRIETCPNASEEIRGICDRAVKKNKRLVPLIEENADLLRRLATAERTLEDERERHAHPKQN